jgi:predicted nuclease of predicted toxin-antitoxin system
LKLLIDANLSQGVAVSLRKAGIDAVHVRERGLMTAPDEQILALALDENRVVVSEDSDFSAILARHRLLAPSFVLIRSAEPMVAEEQVAMLLSNLPAFEEELNQGCVLSLAHGRIRIHPLPI